MRLRRATPAPYYLPGDSLVSARVTLRDKSDRLPVTAEALNLFNDYYYSARFDALFLPTGPTFSTVGRPREFVLKAKCHF